MSSRGKGNKLQDKLNEYIRVLKLAKKPGREEYMQVAKISAIGILLIGSIGFLMYLGMGVAPRTLANMNKGEIEANFVNELNTSNPTQELTLQINNTDSSHSTGELHISFNTVLCNVNETTHNLSAIDPGGTRKITIEVTDVEENSNVIANIWGENAATYDSESNSLEVNAIPSPFRRQA